MERAMNPYLRKRKFKVKDRVSVSKGGGKLFGTVVSAVKISPHPNIRPVWKWQIEWDDKPGNPERFVDGTVGVQSINYEDKLP
jgi:hypothetical protein